MGSSYIWYNSYGVTPFLYRRFLIDPMVGKITLNDYFVSLPYLWQIKSILFSLSFLPNIKRNFLLLSLTYFLSLAYPIKKKKEKRILCFFLSPWSEQRKKRWNKMIFLWIKKITKLRRLTNALQENKSHEVF